MIIYALIMFGRSVGELLESTADTVIERAGFAAYELRTEAHGLLTARSDSAYFKNLAVLGEQAESKESNAREVAIAQLALLESPIRYPNNKVRCIAGAGNSLENLSGCGRVKRILCRLNQENGVRALEEGG